MSLLDLVNWMVQQLQNWFFTISMCLMDRMVQSFLWRGYSESAGQEDCYRIQNNIPPDPTVSHLNPVYNFTRYFSKTRFNIILSSTPVSPE